MGEDSVGVLTPKYNLEPPHYDGIQSLCLMGDLLFSGSRDTCVKKWNLAEQKLEQVRNLRLHPNPTLHRLRVEVPYGIVPRRYCSLSNAWNPLFAKKRQTISAITRR